MARTSTTESTNVHPIRTMSAEQRDARCFAAVRALELTVVNLTRAHTRMKALEKDELTKVTQAYREILRAEDADSVEEAEAARRYHQASEGVLERDELVEDQKAARVARERQIERVEDAKLEVLGLQRKGKKGVEASSKQVDMFADPGDTTGLGWASQGTREVIYTSLIDLDRQGRLDPTQAALMADLAQAGIERVDLGLDAAAAIEAEIAEEQAEAASAEPQALADQDLPF